MTARPAAEKERILSIDVLRGVAVLGILPMNIQYFAMASAAYWNPTAYGDLHGANFVVWLASHVLCDLKFMAIFCMLFGAGIVLMTERAEAAGRRAAALHYRPGWLFSACCTGTCSGAATSFMTTVCAACSSTRCASCGRGR